MHARTLARPLLLCLWLVSVLALTPVYDETLWTKQLWRERWKLDKALFTSNPSDDNPTLVSAFPSIRDTDLNSLDGPYPKSIRRSGKPDVFDAEALDDQTLLQPASQAVRCTVCHTLMTRVWQRLVVDLLKGVVAAPTAAQFLPKYLSEACEKEVVSLLQRTVIYRMEMENDAHSMTFFVLRKRKMGTAPTQSEQAAVQLACKEVLASSQGELAALLEKQLLEFTRDLNALLSKHGLPDTPLPAGVQDAAQLAARTTTGNEQGAGAGVDAGGTGQQAADSTAGGAAAADAAATGAAAGAGQAAAGGAVPGGPALNGIVEKLLRGLAAQLKREGIMLQEIDGVPSEGGAAGSKEDAEEDEYMDPDDDEEEVDCIDLHPMCEQWARDGECDANPNYMVGNNRLKGHCLRACGLCSPSAARPEDLLKSHPALAKEVQTLSSNVMQVLKSAGCGASQGCLTGTSGVAAEGGILAAKAVMESLAAQPSGGFVLGRPSWGYPEVKETAESRGVAHKQKADAQAADQRGEAEVKTELQRHVDAVLSAELGGKLLHLRTEFFTYEYLYKNHTRHFHEDPTTPGKMIEDWSLGSYDPESSETGVLSGDTLPLLHRRDLLPSEADSANIGSLSWPYVRQFYSGGNLCVLGGGRRAIRRTEVRIACSPDGKLQFLVREPDFCSYIFVIYSPGLCTVPEFKPKSQPTPASD